MEAMQPLLQFTQTRKIKQESQARNEKRKSELGSKSMIATQGEEDEEPLLLLLSYTNKLHCTVTVSFDATMFEMQICRNENISKESVPLPKTQIRYTLPSSHDNLPAFFHPCSG